MSDDAIRYGNFVEFGSYVNGDHCCVNLDQVRRYQYLQGQGERVRIWWANGDEDVFTVDGLIAANKYHIVPAQEGFELLSYWPDPEEELLERSPVIAWRINEGQTREHYSDQSNIAISITLTSASSASNMRIAVRHPDGVVSHYADGQVWESVEKWREWAKEDYQKAEVERRNHNRLRVVDG